MKKILKCRVTILLLLSWTVCSVIGYMGKDGIYQNYDIDIKKTPYFVLVLEGIRDGIYPWSGGEEMEEPGSPGGLPQGMLTTEQPDTENVADTGTESGTDTGTEAGTDTGAESGTDTGTEAGTDTGTEAGTDTGTEAGTDAGTEAANRTEAVPLEPKEFVTVDESYFDDAVFIGDSRTVGLHDYSGLDKATFYATVGMNIYDLWTEKFCMVDGEKLTLEEALTKKQFKKIYFQIGINEMGRGTLDGFMQEYANAVLKFQELQPDAIIYVQGIMRVAKAKSDTDPIFNNRNIQMRNDRIAQLADGQKIFYIDMNEVVCDNYGNLREELTFDNLHLYGSKYDIWVDFLKSKGIAL